MRCAWADGKKHRGGRGGVEPAHRGHLARAPRNFSTLQPFNRSTMKVTYTIVSDTVTPDLRARLARVENPEPALRRMGQVLVNWARQAFRDTSKRPASWPQAADRVRSPGAESARGVGDAERGGGRQRPGGRVVQPCDDPPAGSAKATHSGASVLPVSERSDDAGGAGGGRGGAAALAECRRLNG